MKKSKLIFGLILIMISMYLTYTVSTGATVVSGNGGASNGITINGLIDRIWSK